MEEVGERLAAFRRVSHCYHRPAAPGFPYNLYTMVHGRDEDECRRLVDEMSREAGVDEYQMLFSQRELKKTSMQYY